jgi:hypothetical protein
MLWNGPSPGERGSRRLIEYSRPATATRTTGQTTGSSLAADLMVIRVFAVIDIAIPFDDDFPLLAMLA